MIDKRSGHVKVGVGGMIVGVMMAAAFLTARFYFWTNFKRGPSEDVREYCICLSAFTNVFLHEVQFFLYNTSGII